MTVSRAELMALLRLVDATSVEEIDCDEFLDRVGGVLERLGPGDAVPPGSEAVVQHLRLCPECLEEFDTLLRVLKEQG